MQDVVTLGRCISWRSMLPCCPIDKTKRWCLKADKAEHNLVAVRSRILPTLLYPFHRDVGKILLVVAANDNWVSSMLHRRILPIRSLSWRFCLCKWFAYCRPLEITAVSFCLMVIDIHTASSFVSLKTSLPHTNSHSILRAGHAPTRMYAPAHSANFPFLPSPHPATNCRSTGWVWRQALPSPSHPTQQTEIQHVARHSSKKNRWRQKSEAFTRNAQSINDLHPKGEEVKAKIEKHWTRARIRVHYRHVTNEACRALGYAAPQIITGNKRDRNPTSEFHPKLLPCKLSRAAIK